MALAWPQHRGRRSTRCGSSSELIRDLIAQMCQGVAPGTKLIRGRPRIGREQKFARLRMVAGHDEPMEPRKQMRNMLATLTAVLAVGVLAGFGVGALVLDDDHRYR